MIVISQRPARVLGTMQPAFHRVGVFLEIAVFLVIAVFLNCM